MSIDAHHIATATISRDQALERLVRVDHAGEYGAKRIYQGQLSVLRAAPCAAVVTHMLEQELEHLQYFDDQLKARHVRPTLLMPLWHVGGYLMGALTARMSEKAAMTCTVAVETVIDGHYDHQLHMLTRYPQEQELVRRIEKFKADELEHHDTGLAHGAASMQGYAVLSEVIMRITKGAIWLSKRV